MELRPQLAEVVFQRGAGQAQAVARIEQAGALGRLRAVVLDVVRFVEDHQVIIVLAQLFLVARQQRVGGQHQVGAVDLVEQLEPLLALQQQHAQARGEARGLVLPVGHQAGRGDHQGRAGQAAGFLFDQDVGQRLHRLAQAHVVGQDAGEVVFAQELHPRQAVGLVVAQGRLQAGRRRHLLHRTEQAERRRTSAARCRAPVLPGGPRPAWTGAPGS